MLDLITFTMKNKIMFGECRRGRPIHIRRELRSARHRDRARTRGAGRGWERGALTLERRRGQNKNLLFQPHATPRDSAALQIVNSFALSQCYPCRE